MVGWIGYVIAGIIVILISSGIKIVRPIERGLIERLGKYNRFAEAGFHFIIPLVERMVRVDITENMMEIDTQEIITEDNLNAKVDLVVYYKVVEEETAIKKSIYKVSDFEPQITRLAQTTARNVMGTMAFKDVNSKRSKLNQDITAILKKETANWGVEILRVELKEIIPPKEVQDTMNQVIQAENKKRAAVDFATATETEADGKRRALIKEAEGQKQMKILGAEGAAKAFDLVHKHFKGNAQLLKKYEVAQIALQNNSKIILGADSKQILKLFDLNR